MIVRGFSGTVVLAMNIAVIAILSVLAYFLKLAGTEFCLGILVGFFSCYCLHRCWRDDRE